MKGDALVTLDFTEGDIDAMDDYRDGAEDYTEVPDDAYAVVTVWQ